MPMTEITFEIEEDVLKEAKEILNNQGFTLSEAILMFLRETVAYQGLPLATRLVDLALVKKLTQKQSVAEDSTTESK